MRCKREEHFRNGCMDCGECIDCHHTYCARCLVSTSVVSEYYMVHDEVWASAGMVCGLLCIACLESGLGRRLNSSDFTDCRANVDDDVFPKSPRLLNRLGR